MTFDEAIVELKQDRVFKDSVAEGFALDIIDQLQEEYAPTIEMTKEQRIYWERANDNNFAALDKETTSGLFVSGMPEDKSKLTLKVRDSVSAILHPETIKIIGD